MRWLLLSLLVGNAILLSTAALAQAPAPGDLASLTSATPAADWSIRLWKMLFGDFAENPFSTLGGPTTLLGGVFIVFNTCIFTVGFAWALYGIVGGVVSTAHEGEVLGRRMSTVWFPIRMIVGISGMVPIFGGFTLNQAIMMFLTTIGIGIGNTMWTAAVNNTDQFTGIMQTSAMSPASTSMARDVAFDMFRSNICLEGIADLNRQITSSGGVPNPGDTPAIKTESDSGVESYLYGTNSEKTSCGQVSVQSSARSSWNPFAFRAGSVDYAAIARAAQNAYVNQLSSMQTQVASVAQQWYRARATALANGNPVPPVPLDQIDAAANNFVKSAGQSISQYNVDGGAIKAAAKENMLSVGWFGAAAWHSTFAEVNAGIADAAKGVSLTSQPPTSGVNSTTTDALAAVAKARDDALATKGVGSTGDPARALLDSAISDSCEVAGFSVTSIGTATSNCSLGQAIVSAAIRGTAIASGGGGNGGGFAPDSEGLVNPIIMMKNMGDYIMTFSTTIIAGDLLGDMIGKIPYVGTAAKWVLGSDKKADADGNAKPPGAMSKIWMFLSTFAVIFLVIGAAMSIYIPMIPFINWMGAIVAYTASMIEGFAGATLHSMAHLDADGDGMGQRTNTGYMYYINALARPALMLIGFFIASAAMIGIGTLQAHLFLPAMANVQGNSVTGFASIIMFCIIFVVINMTLINACFGLIYVITDNVLSFVGGQVGQRLGQDTEDKANNMFLMAARVGPGAVGNVRAGLSQMKDKTPKPPGPDRLDKSAGR